MTRAVWLAALWLGACGAVARAGVYEERPPCELKEDPETPEGRAAIGQRLCIAGRLGAEAGDYFGTKEEAALLDWGQAYGGLFAFSWLSVQAKGFWRHTIPRGSQAPSEWTLYTDYAVAQLGDPVLNHVRFTAGLTRLPFGIDTSPAPQLYQRLENRDFWESPEGTAYLTFDDLRTIKVEVGLASNDWRRRRIDFGAKDFGLERLDRAGSLRASYDMSALEGTRLTASLYGAKNGQRRYGAGIVNRNRKEDYTEFEWVRLLHSPDGKGAPFDQLLRLAYAMHWQGGDNNQGRWVAEFDDERNRFRRGILDHDSRFWGHLVLRLGLGYQKDESGGKDSHWFGIAGTEADL